MRRGALSPLGFVDENAVTKEEVAADRATGKKALPQPREKRIKDMLARRRGAPWDLPDRLGLMLAGTLLMHGYGIGFSPCRSGNVCAQQWLEEHRKHYPVGTSTSAFFGSRRGLFFRIAAA